MNDPTGLFKMRFIGKPNGVLMKSAPGNFKQGEVVPLPYRHSRFPYWELVEDKPVLKVPAASKDDSVFEEPVYIPDEDEATIEAPASQSIPPVVDPDVNISPDTDATIEPYMSFNTQTGRMGQYIIPKAPIKPVDEPSPEPKELSRDELKQVLDEAGVEYNDKARTSTLKRLVDELGAKE